MLCISEANRSEPENWVAQEGHTCAGADEVWVVGAIDGEARAKTT